MPGHGLQTAEDAGRLRAAVHPRSDLDLEPDELLARLDDLTRRFQSDNGHGTGVGPLPADAGGAEVH
ncbi:hypothetical protein AB0L14_36400 [Streptomyces sp. NPDC052727]|uniref:hypothetical protein n=1 Tax=Streptomyces sp. NPDC052727 TaxID=3154854 RepID=UPI003418BA16